MTTKPAKRPRISMPAAIKKAIETGGLMSAYKARPAYQRNDYLGWIASAKRAETKDKRIKQMLAELRRGGVYMSMTHPPSKTAR